MASAGVAFLLLLLLRGSYVSEAAAVKCSKQLTAWSCRLADGRVIDLKPLSSGPLPCCEAKDQKQESGWYFQWDPARNFSCGGYQASACQTDRKQFSFDIGDQAFAKFDFSADGLFISYATTNHEGSRVSKVFLKCDPNKEKEFTTRGEVYPPKNYEMTLTSRFACPVAAGGGGGRGHGGLSVGSILLISLAVLLAVYLAAGVAVNLFVRHRSGLDLLPNREAWAAAPGLVTDGALFLVRKARGRGDGGYQQM